VLSVAWAHRAELAGPARLADELAFLPAALSLQETPVHPAPRRFADAEQLIRVYSCSFVVKDA
jgi:hemolysin D